MQLTDWVFEGGMECDDDAVDQSFRLYVRACVRACMTLIGKPRQDIAVLRLTGYTCSACLTDMSRCLM